MQQMISQFKLDVRVPNRFCDLHLTILLCPKFQTGEGKIGVHAQHEQIVTLYLSIM